MRVLWLLLLLVIGAGAEDLREFPAEADQPLRVGTGLFVVEVEAIEDNDDRFRAVVDWRVAWTDPRQVYAADAGERRELTDDAAKRKLDTVWTPHIVLANLASEPEITDEDLYHYPNGHFEWIRRLRANFKTDLDHTSFPLDKQRLLMQIASPLYTVNQIVLQNDLDVEFSGHGQLELRGWEFGRLRFCPATVARWNGSIHSELEGTLPATRHVTPYVTSVFLPIAAVMLVPFLALWLNRWSGNSFAVEPFELMNVTTGGLFATIALTLAIYSVYPFLSSGANVVGRLFTLNYLLLGLAMLTILMLFKTQLNDRPWFSPYVALEAYKYISWAAPLLTLILMAAIFAWARP